MNVQLKIAYDGTRFFGWQNNKSERSVEDVLEKALTSVLGHSVILQAASRTDRGVHALGQIVNFFTSNDLNLQSLPGLLNALLDDDVRILSAKRMPDSFHPTLDVLAKQYRYIITTKAIQEPTTRHTSWHFPYIVSLSNMKEAALLIEGTHDFCGFSNKHYENGFRRIDSIKFEEQQEALHIVIKGNHFLYKMVRNIVGTLAYIGSGKLKISVIDEIFSTKDRKKAGMTAPAAGLFLEKIIYPPCFGILDHQDEQEAKNTSSK